MPTFAFAPRPPAARKRVHLTLDDLDDTQRAAVRVPRGNATLVLGEAGHGKTTVAVHRLAHLLAERTRADRANEKPTDVRAAFVVPNEGLARLVQSILRRLGVDLDVRTYDAWAAKQARRAFHDVPRRESELTPAQVSAFKRSPALDAAIAEIASRDPSLVDDDRDAPRVRSRAHARRADLQHLFGDRALLAPIGAPAHVLHAVLDRTRVQFSLTTEREFAHVDDAARLVAVDRRAIDDGTAHANAGTIDVEDYAVLFAIDRARAAHRGRAPTAPRAFDIIVIDEAQELAPRELALLGQSLAPDGTLVVAGDADQQVDPTTTFLGWEATMRALGVDAYERVHLDVGYRCPPLVAAFARFVIGRDASADAPPCIAFEDEARLASTIAIEARTLARRDPRASIVVVCRSPMTARRLADRIRTEHPARLVFDGRFLARGPVQVTTVDETKGLEFDFVVIPDLTARDYPDTSAARRALYVAVTRARHQVLLAHVGERSAIVDARSPGTPSPIVGAASAC
jgi:DNA helicase IV